MLNFDGSIPCPPWCSRLFCATEFPVEERWHRSRIRSVPTYLSSRTLGTGSVQSVQLYLSQAVREVEPTINFDLGDAPLIRLRPMEGAQLLVEFRSLVELLGVEP